MKKEILTSAIALSLVAPFAGAAVKKLDGTNGIVTSSFPAGLTTYRVIDCAGGTVTLSSADEWVLDGITFVENGVLEIEAGTIIRGELASSINTNDVGALVITRSGRIDAQGTASDPIIFTTAAIDNDLDGEADGLMINNILDGSGDIDYFTKTGAQWTGPTDTFLDADPKNNPLAPTKTFANDVAPSKPADFFNLDAIGGDETYLENTPEYRSLWGGIVVLGNAPTSIGLINEPSTGVYEVIGSSDGDIAGNFLNEVYEGFVEGLNIVEIGERGVYGGHNPNDNSGVMRFVSVRHGGASIGDGNELNGITFAGVGRGSVMEYLEVYCNGDDGYEWFGGTSDHKYLISLYNNDDSFDIDEGYTGRGQFWFSLQLDDQINGDHGGEHDGTAANHDSINLVEFGTGENGGGLVSTFITVYNATYIGGGTNGNTTTDSGENNAFRLRDSWGGIYRNSIFSDFKDDGLRIDSDLAGRVAQGEVIFESNMFYGNAAAFPAVGDVYRNSATDDIDLITNDNTIAVDPFNGRRNGDPFFGVPAKFDRRGLFNSGVNSIGFDPRPDQIATVTSNLASYDPAFFSTVGYKGAFAPGASVNSIWTGAAASVSNPAWSVFGAKVLDLQ